MCSVDQAIQNISDCINRAHGETIGITCVVENMVCSPSNWYFKYCVSNNSYNNHFKSLL